MAIIKSYTDVNQSRKLVEILSFESADMWWAESYTRQIMTNGQYIVEEKPVFYLSLTKPSDSNCSQNIIKDIPCWSLAALLNVIPQELFGGEYIINITEGLDNKWIISYESHYEVSSYIDTSSDSLIDCCVEMIIKLKERNLL